MFKKAIRENLTRGLTVATFATAGVVAAVAPASAIDVSIGSPQCHQSVFQVTKWGVDIDKKRIATVEFDSYQKTISKGPRTYKLYTHTSGAILSLSDPKSSLFADGCGGGPTLRVGDSSSNKAVPRFVFSGQTLYYDLFSGKATETLGAINEKYASIRYEQGLGVPTTDEQATPTKEGRYNHFTGGSIYWSPATGAHIVKGVIRDKWASLGWERGDMGFPVTDELDTPNRKGKYNHFQAGWSIYWSPATGAHEIHGQIRDKWAALGWETSRLGFPTTDEVATSGGGRRQTFQNGCHIQWYPGRGATAYCTDGLKF